MPNWKDGQPYSDRCGDVYFSADSGVEETRHVFLHGNHPDKRFEDFSAGRSFCIGETGFGSGLNFLVPGGCSNKPRPQVPLPRTGNKGKCTA